MNAASGGPHRKAAATFDRFPRSLAELRAKTRDEVGQSGSAATQSTASNSTQQRRNVFVVHGRDEQVREQIFALLRAVDLRPMEWESLVSVTQQTAPSLLDVVRTALAQAQAVVVLLTPDDVVWLHPTLRTPRESATETTLSMQVRPNVLIELGMALMASPDRTIILEIGGLRPVGDIVGLNVIRFDGTEIAVGKIIQRLKSAGCCVDDSGADWRSLRRFAGLDAYYRCPEDASAYQSTAVTAYPDLSQRPAC